MKIRTTCLLVFVLLADIAIASPRDSLWTKIYRKSFPTYDEELIFHDKKRRFATFRTFDKSGMLMTETNFKDYSEGIRQGFSKGFYPNGQLYWIADYRNNELFGEFRVYYQDGSLKRREIHRSGMRKAGYCYDRSGEEIPFFEFFREPQFPGGDYALQSYIRKKLKGVNIGTQNEFYALDLLIQADSVAVLNRFGSNQLLSVKHLAELIRDMPKWSPAYFDEVPHDKTYSVNLVFRNGSVYIANILPDLGGVYRKKFHAPEVPSSSPPIPGRRR